MPPTATEVDYLDRASAPPPPANLLPPGSDSDDSSRTEAGDSRSPGGGKWQQRLQERCRQRYTKFGINVYSTRKPASLDTNNGNSLQRVNLCTDILLQPELYLELFSHKGKNASSNPLLELCLDGGQLPKEDHVDLLIKSDLSSDANRETQQPPSDPSPLLLNVCSKMGSKRQDSSRWQHPHQQQHQKQQQLGQHPCQTCLETASALAAMSNTNSNNSCDNVDCCLSTIDLLTNKSQIEGCDINVQDSQGYSALHFLINGCSKENFEVTLKAVRLLVGRGADPSLPGTSTGFGGGNTPLSLVGQTMLQDRGLHKEGHLMVQALLTSGRDVAVNHVNRAGRSMLSYAVSQGDVAVKTTTLLLNHGASVLPSRAETQSEPSEVSREREQSAFNWFLKSVVRRHSLDGTAETSALLCQTLCQELGTSSRMKQHVLSTMVHVLTPCSTPGLFLQLKQVVSVYWRDARPLKQLCLQAIRSSLGPKNLPETTQQLNLPKPLTSYLQLN